MYTVHLHVMSLSSCALRTNSLTLFKGLTAVVFVMECDCFSLIEFQKTFKWKPLTMRFVGIVVSGLVSGSYYDGGGASVIDASKTSKST